MTDIATLSLLAAGMEAQAEASERAAQSIDRFSQAMSELPAQIAQAMASVNSGSSSFMDFVAQGNELKGGFDNIRQATGMLTRFMGAAFAPVAAVAAGIGLLGTAYSLASKESEEFSKQLKLTGGYASQSASQLIAMSRQIGENIGTQSEASAVLAKVVGTGSFDSAQLQSVTLAAMTMEEATGQSVDTTIANFQRLQQDPLRAAQALDQQIHFLTASQLEQIATLEASGNTTAAARVAMDAYAESIKSGSEKSVENLGALESVWKSITETMADAKKVMAEAKDAFIDIGRADPLGERVEDARKRAENAQKVVDNMPQPDTKGYGRGKHIDELGNQHLERQRNEAINTSNKARAEYEALQEQKYTLDKINALEKQAQDEETIKKRQFQADQQLKKRYETAEEKHQRKLADIRNSNASKEVKDESIRRENENYAKQNSVNQRKPTTTTANAVPKQLDNTATREREAALKAETQATKAMQEKTKDFSSRNDFAERTANLTSRGVQRERQKEDLRYDYESKSEGITDPKRITELTAEYTKAREMLQAGFDAEDTRSGDWIGGLENGIRQFAETSLDVFSATSALAQKTFSGLSTMAYDLVTTGTANVKEFTANFLKSILEIITQLLVAYAIQSLMKWVSGSSGGASISGGGGDEFGFSSFLSGSSGSSGQYSFWDEGGYTGNGGKYQPAGIVHRGEFVMTKEATSKIGVNNLYALMESAKGYANGGLVTDPGIAASVPSFGGGSGGNQTFQTTVIVKQDGDTQSKSDESKNNGLGAIYQQIIDSSIREGIAAAIRPGGMLWNFQYQR